MRALDLADDRETRVWANYWMSKVVDDPAQKRAYLEETLASRADPPRSPPGTGNPGWPAQARSAGQPRCPARALPRAAAREGRPFHLPPVRGGRMVYAPDGRSLYCEYCTRNQTLSSQAVQQEQDFILTMATAQGHQFRWPSRP